MGVDFHSLVESPAIEVLYKTFGKSERYKFNQDKQIITGPFMIPDLPIYRNDASHGEYYVVFDKQTIIELNEMFMKEQKTLSFNYQHMDNSKVDGAVLVENWIVGEGDNKAKELGFEVPIGTWMGSVKINNKEFWEKEIKSGNAKGFSIEGYLDMQMKSIKKNKFMEAKTKDGVYTITTTDEVMAVNSPVTIKNADGTDGPKEGEFELENGTILKVLNGAVTEMIEATLEEEITPEEVAAMSKMFAKVIEAANKPLLDKITALETKVANMPAAGSATDSTDDKDKGGEGKLSPTQTALAKFNSIKTIIENNKKK